MAKGELNTKAIVANVRFVFERNDIRLLNKPAYEFIHVNMGFIAHYDLAGFQHEYRNLWHFAETLQTGEMSQDINYNSLQAMRLRTEGETEETKCFDGILTAARNYLEKRRASLRLPLDIWIVIGAFGGVLDKLEVLTHEGQSKEIADKMRKSYGIVPGQEDLSPHAVQVVPATIR